jgi:hypothetical protein
LLKNFFEFFYIFFHACTASTTGGIFVAASFKMSSGKSIYIKIAFASKAPFT